MNRQLNGKATLVSGSTTAIGFAITRALVNGGARYRQWPRTPGYRTVSMALMPLRVQR